jgi:hypothetical protein
MEGMVMKEHLLLQKQVYSNEKELKRWLDQSGPLLESEHLQLTLHNRDTTFFAQKILISDDLLCLLEQEKKENNHQQIKTSKDDE